MCIYIYIYICTYTYYYHYHYYYHHICISIHTLTSSDISMHTHMIYYRGAQVRSFDSGFCVGSVGVACCSGQGGVYCIIITTCTCMLLMCSYTYI